MRVLLERKQLAIGIGLLLAVLTVNAGVTYRLTRELHENSRWVAHTHEVLGQLDRLMGAVTDAETGQRGFLITGDASYLAPYEAARNRYDGLLDSIAELTVDNPVQKERLPKLREMSQARLDVLKELIETQKTAGQEPAREALLSGRGLGLMQELRSLIEAMRDHETGLLRLRREQNDHTYRLAVVGGLIALLMAAAAVAGFAWMLLRHLGAMAVAAVEIHHRRELLQSTLSSIADGVIATDRRGCITFSNPVAQKLTGWSQADAEGQPLEQVFHIVNEETRKAVENPALRAIREGRSVGLADHTVLVSRDGTEWPIDDSAAPITTVDGTIDGAVLVFREISERQRQERLLLKQTQDLEAADRNKDEFLATLAHELRNPLAPISNALQIWPLLENDRAEMDKLRHMMDRQVRQMTRLVDDLLDVSRITRGKIRIRKEPVDLKSLVDGAVEGLQAFIDTCQHHLIVELPDEPLIVDGDPARLTQIFGNILHNAAKYTDRGGRIEIFAQRHDGRAVIRIRDNGPGIPPQMLGRVFEMFQQMDQTLERAHGGLGIGLTLVKRLVQLHDGTVEARSSGAGTGAEFIVSLPALADQQALGPTRSDSSRSENLPRLKILVVDDVQASAKTLAIMLESIGQDVSVVHDGAQAIELVAETLPDVVFLDIAMPGMDGYEVAGRIRGREGLKGVYLVALTGYAQDDDRRRAIEAGFDHHLTKPTSIKALQQLIAARPEPKVR